MTQLPDSGLVLVYTTFPDMAVAKNVCMSLVKDRLAACANIFPAMTAIYEWQGNLETEDECAVLLKTQIGLAEALMKSLKSRHPYDTPAILTIPISAADEDYSRWLHAQTDLGITL